MVPECFHAQLCVKLDDDVESNGIYKTEESLDKLEARPCIILSMGDGYLDGATGNVIPLPYNVGDRVSVKNGNWTQVESGGEKYLITASQYVLCRIAPKREAKSKGFLKEIDA